MGYEYFNKIDDNVPRCQEAQFGKWVSSSVGNL